MKSDDRWRGRMPFRFRVPRVKYKKTQAHSQLAQADEPGRLDHNYMTNKRRTGEPSPAIFTGELGELLLVYWGFSNVLEDGGTKWADDICAGYINRIISICGLKQGVITFQYRMSRHKIVTVVGHYSRMIHNKFSGFRGKKFIVVIRTISVDGLRMGRGVPRIDSFALNRIILTHDDGPFSI